MNGRLQRSVITISVYILPSKGIRVPELPQLSQNKIITSSPIYPTQTHTLLISKKPSSVLKLPEISTQTSSIRRQKGEAQNGCYKKTKQVNFFEKHSYFLIRTCTFFGKFRALCFLVTRVLRSTLLPYRR